MSARFMTVTTAISPAFGQLRCDKDMQKVLRTLESLKPVALGKWTRPADARKGACMADAVRILRDQNPLPPADATAPVVSSTDLTLQTDTGHLHARVYTPEEAGPFPVVLYFHGGGWVLGSIDSDDAGARGIAACARAVVISVNYRLAPEHPFPAAWEDALAAYQWLLDHAACIQGDASRIALAGEGAGGNLALATAISARDKGLALPRHVLAISPVTQTSTNTHSYLENAVASPFGRNDMVWCLERLVTSRDHLEDPRLQLVDAVLAGLPPVTLITARIDPLRSDAQKLFEALLRAQVRVEWRDLEGVTNGFFNVAEVVEKAREAHAYVGEQLAAALADSLPASGRAGSLGLTRVFRQLVPELRAASPERA